MEEVQVVLLSHFSVSSLVLVFLLGLADLAVTGETLDGSSQDHFKEGDYEAKDQPDVDHLHVRGGGQLLDLAGEDGGHHQHDGQVHSDGIAKQGFVKEDGDEGDEEQEDGGEVGGQQLSGHLPLEHYGHDHQLLLLEQGQVLDGEHGQVDVLLQKIVEILRHTVHVHHQHLRATIDLIKILLSIIGCPTLHLFLN